LVIYRRCFPNRRTSAHPALPFASAGVAADLSCATRFFVKRTVTSYTDDPGIHHFFEGFLRDQYALANVIGDRQIYVVK
jgi:hypothetical protein